MKIKICEPDITQLEIDAVTRVLTEGQLSGETKVVKEFEEAFAKYIGTKYAVAVSSGWAALFLASWVLLRGKSILVPDITMIASANAAALAGAKIVCCDVDENGLINLKHAEALNQQFDAVMPVHLYGQPVDLSGFEWRGRIVIEDCAESLGARIGAKQTGSFGTVGCFSFYANKIITTGEGGMITTDDQGIYEELIKLRSHYFGSHDKFSHEKIGFNFRMPAMCAALGLAQLSRVEELVYKRIQTAEFYNARLAGLVKTPANIDKNNRQVYWMYVIHTPDRDNLLKYLESCRIEVRKYFSPLHEQAEYKDRLNYYHNSPRLSETGLLLPHTSDENKQYVCDKIAAFFETKRTG